MSRINKSYIDFFYDYNLLLETRTLYLGSDINEHTSADIVKGLRILEHSSIELPITIVINSHGGDEEDGYAIYDAIKSSQCHITGEVLGQASSMSSIILQACDVRVMHPNAICLVHDGDKEFSEGERVKPAEEEENAKWSKYSRYRMYKIYAGRSNKPVKFWDKVCKSDYIMTAQECLEFGFIDEIKELAHD